MKRSRGRGRRQQNPVNRSYDSNGPDVRVRGTASQVYEKYQALARDAMSSGDRVMAENYQQHAEHYFRIVQSFQPTPSETDRDASGDANENRSENGSENGAADESKSVDGGEAANGAEPLVLVRDGDGGEKAEGKSAGKSRRRGPLGKRRGSKAANGDAENVNAETADTADVAEVVEEVAAASETAEPKDNETTLSGE